MLRYLRGNVTLNHVQTRGCRWGWYSAMCSGLWQWQWQLGCVAQSEGSVLQNQLPSLIPFFPWVLSGPKKNLPPCGSRVIVCQRTRLRPVAACWPSAWDENLPQGTLLVSCNRYAIYIKQSNLCDLLLSNAILQSCKAREHAQQARR